MSQYTVYKSVCLVNGKVYFGITSGTLRNRARKHVWEANHKAVFRFHLAIRKHGSGNFRWETVAVVDSWDEACRLEIDLIRQCGTRNPLVGYNDTDGGQGRFGKKASEETKKKMSLAQRRRGPMSEAQREKLRLAWKSRPLTTDLTRLKMSQSRKGKPMNFSAEARERIAVNRGKPSVGKGEKRA